jgi:uncharacterized sulfatase
VAFPKAKATLFDSGLGVALILRGPDFSGGRVVDGLVSQVDLFPTLCQSLRLPVPPGLQGKSLVPLLKNPKAPWDRPAYSTVTHQKGAVGRSVRTERYRYTEWDDGRAGRQLNDHDADPREYKNLADDPGHRAVAARMKALLDKVRTTR